MLQALDLQSGVPLDAGRQIRADYARNLRLAIDAGAATMPPEAMPYHTGKSRNGYVLVGTRTVGPSGPGWLGSTSTSLQCNTSSASSDEVFQLPANSDFTAQFVVDNFGGSTGYPCFFRSGSGSLSNNLMLTNETRRPFIRVNGSDILRPGSGAQWTDGQNINYIVRFRNASTIEAWWDGALKHSASHSASLPDISGEIEAVYKLLISGGGDEVRGNVSAIRVWSRWLADAELKELADDPGALYEPQQIWVPVSAGGGAAEIGLATETDAALALTSAQRLGVGQAQETDSALPLTSAQALAIGQALEQDTALPIGSSQTLAIGQAIEQDIAQPLGSGTVVAIGQAVESDSAQPLASQQSLAIGQAVETDTAQPLDVVAGGFLGIALEQDIAQPLTAAQRLAIGQAQESDTALALLAGQGKAIGLALESDTALPVQALLGLGLAQEQDTALPLIAPPPPPPPPATESETTAGYRRNPRTPRELDPLPAEDLADQVRDKWDAIERANEAVRRARRGPPPAAAVAPTQAPAPKPQKPGQRRASAAELSAVAGGIGLQLTPEQLADEEAFILLVAELV